MGALPAYLEITKVLFRETKCHSGDSSCNCEYVRKHCLFNVIGVKDSAIEAALLESDLISKNVNNPKFLNINKASTYTQRNNKNKSK
jgi:hypothetical protein